MIRPKEKKIKIKMSRKRATKLPSVILLMLSTVCLHHVIPSAHAQSSPDQTSNTDPAAGTDIRGTNGDVTDPDPPEEIGPGMFQC